MLLGGTALHVTPKLVYGQQFTIFVNFQWESSFNMCYIKLLSIYKDKQRWLRIWVHFFEM